MSPPLWRVVVRLSLLYVALLVLVALFADLLVSTAPLVLWHRGSLSVLPGITGGSLARQTADHLGPQDWAVWAPLRPTASGQGLRSSASFAQTVAGVRHVVVTTSSVVAIALALGVSAGMLAGAASPFVDALLARAVELSSALPALILLAIARLVEGRPDVVTFVLIVGVLRAVRVARVVRGETLRVAGQDYVVAARALGLPPTRLLTGHILPHVLEPALICAAFTAATVVGLEASLSFVGLGPWPASGSWGSLVGRSFPSAACLWPLAAIVLTTGALYALADEFDASLGKRRRRREPRAARTVSGL